MKVHVVPLNMSSLSGALLESISIAPQFVAFYGVNWSRWCQTLLLEYSNSDELISYTFCFC